MKNRVIILVCAALAYGARFYPTYPLRDWVLRQNGFPPYRGLWAFIPHVFLYTTLGAAVCAVFWTVLARKRLLPPIPLGKGIGTVRWGLAGAAIALALSFAFLGVGGELGKLHWIPPDWWLVAGNFFSNFYEEFIYRGFLLTSLEAVFGFWPAAVISSVLFGAEHTQYPLPLQVLIALCSVPWCWIRRRTGSLWSVWISHELLDLIMDSLLA